MSIFDWLKKGKARVPAEDSASPAFDVYAGMRVEVLDFQEQLLFVARLVAPRDNTARLLQFSENSVEQADGPVHVRIRGYSDYEKKAVYMEGTITPQPRHEWLVEDLTVSRVGNDRAFFRLDTDVEASLTRVGGIGGGVKTCRMLNISIGGACIGSSEKYHEGDKFLLNVKILEDREPSVMLCQILRITEKGPNQYEYGCRFLALSEADKERITQNIFAVQRKKRG